MTKENENKVEKATEKHNKGGLLNGALTGLLLANLVFTHDVTSKLTEHMANLDAHQPEPTPAELMVEAKKEITETVTFCANEMSYKLKYGQGLEDMPVRDIARISDGFNFCVQRDIMKKFDLNLQDINRTVDDITITFENDNDVNMLKIVPNTDNVKFDMLKLKK